MKIKVKIKNPLYIYASCTSYIRQQTRKVLDTTQYLLNISLIDVCVCNSFVRKRYTSSSVAFAILFIFFCFNQCGQFFYIFTRGCEMKINIYANELVS